MAPSLTRLHIHCDARCAGRALAYLTRNLRDFPALSEFRVSTTPSPTPASVQPSSSIKDATLTRIDPEIVHGLVFSRGSLRLSIPRDLMPLGSPDGGRGVFSSMQVT